MQIEEETFTIQKQEQILQAQYAKSLELLYNDKFNDGLDALNEILKNPLIQSLQSLKYSVLLSAAELQQKVKDDIDESIKCTYQALKIKQDYTLYKRLSDTCIKGGYYYQGQYCIQMAINSCPILMKNYLVQKLIDIKLLEQKYSEALEIVNILINQKFAIQRQKPKRLYCLNKLGRFQQANILSTTVSSEFINNYDEQRQLLNKRQPKTKNYSSSIQNQENNNKILHKNILQINIGGKSSWHSLIGQIYLMLKYLLVVKQQRKKTLKPKYKGLQQYFSLGSWVSRPIKLNQSEMIDQQDKTFAFCQIFMNLKRRKTKDTSTKVSTNEIQKKYIQVQATGNIKDWILNTGIHIDSLINLQNKNKQKNLQEIVSIKQLNNLILPSEDFYSQFLQNINGETDKILVIDGDNNYKINQNKNIQMQQEIQLVTQSIDSKLQDDFSVFYSKKQHYINIYQLTRDIIVHFLADRINNNLLTPHPLLQSQQSIIIPLLTKLYLMCQKLCKNLFTQIQLITPILELTVERYGQILRTVSKNKDKQIHSKSDRDYLRKIIIQLQSHVFSSEFGRYISNLSQSNQLAIKLRVYHSLSIFYSYYDQQIIQMSDQMVSKYQAELIKYKQQVGIDEVSRFWLSTGSTKPKLRQYVENRIKQNILKKQIDQKGSSLSDALSVSIENFKKHKQTNQALELYYKNIFDLLQDSSIYPIFLTHVGQIFEIYIEIIDRKPYKEDFPKYIHKIGELMRIQDIASLLIKKTNQQTQILQQKKQDKSLIKQFMKLIVLLTKACIFKFLLLQPEQQSHHNVFKGLLSCLNQIFKHIQRKDNPIMNDVIIFIHQMAHFAHDNSNVHKKINIHFIPKYVESLLKDQRINEQNIIITDSPSKSSNENQKQQPLTYRQNVQSILDCYYGFSGKKQNDFELQTNKDVQNYVSYLKHFCPEYFTDPSLKIKLQISNVLRQCRKIQKQMTISVCPGFDKFKQKVNDWYNFDKKQQLFIQNIKNYIENGSPSLCSQPSQLLCFQNVKDNHQSFLDVNYLVARGLQNQQVTDNQQYKKDIERGIKKAERIYVQLLCFNIQKVQYWFCVSKINKKKAYIGFDEIIYKQMSSDWKNGFIASKRLAAFMKTNLKMNQQINQKLEQDTLILNLLKIYERKMLYLESKVNENNDAQTKKNKLIDAYQTVIARTQTIQWANNQRISFLFLIFCKYPYVKNTMFSASECLFIIKSLKALHQTVKNKNTESQQKILNEQEVYMQIIFMLFEMLRKYHRTLYLIEQRMGESDNLLKLGYKDLQKFISTIFQLYPNLSKKIEEDFIDVFDIGSKKMGKNELSFNNMQNQVKWLYRLSESCTFNQFPNIKNSCSTLLINIKNQISQCFKKIQSKKGKFHRYYVNCCYYLSKYTCEYQNNPKQALIIINQATNLKSDQIVMVYRYYQNQSLERDSKLAEFFNRNLFFFINKNKIIKWIVNLLWQCQENDKLFQLYRKFMKSVPKEDDSSNNKIFALLYQIALKGIIAYLLSNLQKGPLNEQGQKWMLQLYDKNIKRRKGKDKDNQNLTKLVIEYYRKSDKYEPLASNVMECERGKNLLQQKLKAKKIQKEQKTNPQ